MNKTSLFHLSVFTLFGFSLIAYILLFFNQQVDFWELLSLQNLHFKAVSIGLGIGILAAVLGLLLMKILPEGNLSNMMDSMMRKLDPKWQHIFFYSFCAGVGEEILFRGAIQSYIHLWPTAIIFVLIHGYLSLKDKTMFIYGVFLIFISGSFGYLFKFLGIYAAISAHFIYDVLMFAYMKKK
ncbi:MAG: CPBP family intramembrane metalloprotease [Chitinophagales bacterium]|nr:CPBP family intramembrane metalloprotease [Bacteroidota bacterium]MCB9255660.1 CPBP family intramembrane metalloprotease [Chitinophagales bacterium]